MPNVGIHFILAREVLARWKARPASAPIDHADPTVLSAFLHGAVAPDLGYFPSGDRLLSELVHLVRSGDFARALLRSAKSEQQRAYAFGWTTHLLADAAIHPLINRAAEDLVHRLGESDALAHARAHMRVEYGLDVASFALRPGIAALRFTHPIDRSAIALLSRAFGEIHGLGVSEESLIRSHEVSARVSRAGIRYDSLMSARFRNAPANAIGRAMLRSARLPLLLAPGVLKRSPLLSAVFEPTPPPERLLTEVDAVVSSFAEEFAALHARGFETLQNHDLVLGGPADPDNPSPRAARAMLELEQRRARNK